LDRFDKEGFDEANIQFQRALMIDPSFGRAADGLAMSRTVMAEWGFVPAREGFEEARRAALLALRLNPDSFGGHTALAAISLVYDWDWRAAEQQRDEALKIDPQNSYVLAYASHLAMARGNCAEALRVANAARAVDPLWAPNLVTIGWIQLCIGNLAAAETAMRRAIDISPNYVAVHLFLGKVLLARGTPRAALVEMMAEVPEGGQTAGLALAYHALGRTADADAALSKLIKGRDWAYETAVVYAYHGEKDLAFKWLDIAYMQKDVELYLFNVEPMLRGLHDDPRYKAFLRKMNLLE
jgi:tetratricopeptide (TPR) repeat protein